MDNLVTLLLLVKYTWAQSLLRQLFNERRSVKAYNHGLTPRILTEHWYTRRVPAVLDRATLSDLCVLSSPSSRFAFVSGSRLTLMT